MAAVGAEDGVVVTQMSADAGGNSFFPDVGVAGAGNEAGLVGADQLFLATADGEHPAVQSQEGFFRMGFDALRGEGGRHMAGLLRR